MNYVYMGQVTKEEVLSNTFLECVMKSRYLKTTVTKLHSRRNW